MIIKYKYSLIQMNWDCSLIMRSSFDQNTQLHHKFPKHKIKTINPDFPLHLNDIKKLPEKHKQQIQDRSKEIKKKTSLKSKNTSRNKMFDVDSNNKKLNTDTKINCFNYKNKVAPTIFIPCNKLKQVRLQTQPCTSSNFNPYSSDLQAVKSPRQIKNIQNYKIASPRFNIVIPSAVKFTTSTSPPITLNKQQTNHNSKISQVSQTVRINGQKVTPFYPSSRIHSPTFNNNNCVNYNKNSYIQLKKINKISAQEKQNIKSYIESPKMKVQSMKSTCDKPTFHLNKSEKKKVNRVDKQNIGSTNNQVKQFNPYSQRNSNLFHQQSQQQHEKWSNENSLIQHHLQQHETQRQKPAAVRTRKISRIQDLLSERSQIRSLKDSDEGSVEHSRVITSYRDVIQHRGVLRLNSEASVDKLAR